LSTSLSAATPSFASAHDADACIVGAGVIGTIIARDMASCGYSSIVLDKEDVIGGVWSKNDYPGLKLQGGSVAYRCWSLAPKWTIAQPGEKIDTRYRATGKEVLNYIHEMCAHQLIDVRTNTAYLSHVKEKQTFIATTSQGEVSARALYARSGSNPGHAD
jgi:cation diffusion facilitator CzcD-associated flavoprotein CzcO